VPSREDARWTTNSGLDVVAKSKVPRPRQEMNPNINSMYGKYPPNFSVPLPFDSLFLLTVFSNNLNYVLTSEVVEK
jgi:hypothetical protein